jgi:hypothetical protein
MAVPVLVFVWLVAGTASVAASPPREPSVSANQAVKLPSAGYDISYPQCGGSFPRDPAFGVVGVNRGIVFSANPCLGAGNGPSELAWAGPQAELYANTGNPGPELSSHWPAGQTSPRLCSAADLDSADCAYDYGWNAVADSYATALRAYISLGWAEQGATRTPVANRWWLDVETANSWRSDTALNTAALQGAVDYLLSMEVESVGFYSTPSMWTQVTGGTTAFAEHRVWVAGARTLQGAKSRCIGSGFTGGGVELAQYLAKGFDADYRC